MAAFVLALIAGAPTAHAAPPWTQQGASLNISGAAAVTDVAMSNIGTTPHVAFLEAGNVYARRWNGSAWVQDGAARLNTAAGAGIWVAAASDASNLYVAWTETTAGFANLYVKRWDGAAWTALGGSLNVSASRAALRPSIAVGGGTVTVTWAEDTAATNDIYVKQWNGSVWNSIGGAVEPAPGQWVYQSAVTGDAGNLYVGVTQWDNTNYDVYAQRWNGSAWVTVGAAGLNANAAENAWHLDAIMQGTRPVLAWSEETSATCDCRIYAKNWDGTSWNSYGGFVNAEGQASFAKVDMVPGATGPYLAYRRVTTPFSNDVVGWTGSAWRRYGGTPSTRHLGASYAALTTVSGVPWIAYAEPQETGSAQLEVRRWNPTTTAVGNLTGFAAAADTGQASFTWTNPPDGDYTGVEVWRSTTQGQLGTLRATVAPAATSWGESGLTDGTRYYYTFITTDATGNRRELVWDTADSNIAPGRFGAAVESDGASLFAFGGYQMYGAYRSDILGFNFSSGMTSVSGALSTARASPAAVWVGGTVNRIIVMGGDGGAASTAIQRFDPVTGLMTSAVATLPGARAGGIAAYSPATGRVYYLGGSSTRWGGGTVYDSIYWYDPVADTSGVEATVLPQPMWRMGGTYWTGDSCIYMFGGRTTADVDTNRIVRYCPGAGTAVNMAQTLPLAMSEIAVSQGSRGLVLLGASATAYQQPIYEFDPFERAFLQHPFPMRMPYQQVTNAISTAIDDVIYTAAPYPQSAGVTQVNLGVVVDVTPSSRPLTPTNVTPANAAVVATAAPTLTSSAFSDPDAGATHFASHWQLRTFAGTYVTPARDSGLDLVNLTSFPTSGLAEGRYCWRVRHRDQNRVFSSWSTETCFWVDAVAQNPIAAATLAQYRANGTTVIPSGGYTTDGVSTNVVLKFVMADPDGSQTLTPWVEVRAGATAFSVACGTSVAGVTVSGTGVVPATPDDPVTGTVNVTGLVAGTTYRWRACARDNTARSGTWTAKGATPDFRVVADQLPTATHLTPAAGSTWADTTPTFVATFTDPDGPDTGTIDVEVCTLNPAPAQTCTGIGGTLTANGATASGIANGSTGNWTAPVLGLGNYYWRVRARDQYDLEGAWSSSRLLTIGPPSLTIGVDSASVSVTGLMPSVDATATTVVTISTTSSSGYALTSTDASDTGAATCTVGSCAGAWIPDWTGTGATPTTWAAGTTGGAGHFGLTVLAVTGQTTTKLAKWGTGSTATDYVNNKYAGLRTTPSTLHVTTGFNAGNDTVTTAYRAIAAPSGTLAGSYSAAISYAAVANP